MMINDFFNLLFPCLCAACDQALHKGEEQICMSCQVALPKTNFHLDKNNPLTTVFAGRVKIEMVAACYRFSKKSKVQRLLYQLKYKNNMQLGEFLGEIYGLELKSSLFYKDIECIVPVPLHPKKLQRRGYNQSECFARGLSKALQVTLNTESLYRNTDTETQTKKERYQRWENVAKIFEVKNADQIQNKAILLVDDVVTTGATLEACAQQLLRYNCKVYIAIIAYA